MSEALNVIQKGFDSIEAKFATFELKAAEEKANAGKVSHDTQAALDAIGIKQRELADELLALKQKQGSLHGSAAEQGSGGKQFVESDAYKAFAGGSVNKARFEAKNTITGATGYSPTFQKPTVAGGIRPILTIESVIPSVSTAFTGVEYTREVSFTNLAAGQVEGSAKAESSIVFELVNAPVQTIAHFLRITRQLAADRPALQAYIEGRLTYGVNAKAEQQIISGTGVSPQLSGFMNTGNYTLHGIVSGGLPDLLGRISLIRLSIGKLLVNGYRPTAIVLNPSDWAAMEVELLTTAAGQTLFNYTDAGVPTLYGVPIVQSVGMSADKFAVGDFSMATTIYNREGTVIELSDSDSDNFTKNLVTLRAERRLLLASEIPSAIIGGDLTPPASMVNKVAVTK